MPEKKRSRAPLLLLLIALAVLAAAVWLAFSVGPVPDLEIRTGFDGEGEVALLGRSSEITVRVAEPRRGVGAVTVTWMQDGEETELAAVEQPTRSPWVPWAPAPHPETLLTLTLDREAVPGLGEGPGTIRLVAGRSSGPLRWPEPAVLERSFTVRMTPPSLGVRSTTHYVAQGGCEAVVYDVGETASLSGVRSGDWVFPGYPLPGGDPGERFAFFAVPYDVADVSSVKLFAEDEVGNRVERGFVDRFFERPLGTDTIRVGDAFLEKVVPDILSRTPELQAEGDLLDRYLAINRDLRTRNRAELRQLAAGSRQEFLWHGPFLSLRNAQAMAGFAERRTYTYDGKPVDQQDHLGFDLASTARAPVQAANDGIVVKAGWFGIYGDAVVIDHGYGLMSLYGHLSSVEVQEGEAVTRGQEIGRTGSTGLAGGDHLHFAMLLQGLPVNPREWWDDHWIEDRLRRKLGSALPG